MVHKDFQSLDKGLVKRKVKRRVGVFIDGIGLDRATRRLSKKVDFTNLVNGLVAGLPLDVARYYTLVPNEDDARQFAFLEAIEKAGLEVVVKRLPPKGVNRTVSIDPHIAADLVSFSCGRFHLDDDILKKTKAKKFSSSQDEEASEPSEPKINRVCILVCPSRDLSYPIYLCKQLGAETTLADFGIYKGSEDGWLGIDHFVDLSTSEVIWRD